MKTKYLLMTAALSGLFAACTQEDFLDAPATPATDPLAGRPVVGVVDFKTDEPTTRYNAETATPDVGDALGLYLMDEFRGDIEIVNGYPDGEWPDANKTPFTYQSNWWEMYKPVNYIQSNYGYVLQEDGKWINRASQLVEGNYIVMYRKNDEATNRRDLWQYINPNVELKHHSTRTDKYYVNRDNQFMLDYKQIYRDQKADETGKLTIDVKFKPILTYAKFVIENQAANDFVAEKIVFKAPGDKPLPTVAYVKPDGVLPTFIYNKYNEIEKAGGKIDVLKDECDNTIAEGLYYDEYFTQKVARSMVQYATTEKQVPYGLEDTNTAFEYVFNFPDEEEGGVLLKANNTGDPSDRVLGVSIALPAFEMPDFDWTDMQVVVYGKMWDQGSNDMKGSWRPGILINLRGTADNQVFDLDKFKLWESGMEIPTAQLKFDDQSFVQGEEIRVQTTADLINLINSRLSSITTTQDVDFEVYPYGNGLEITDEVVSLIDTYKKEHGVDVTLIFKHTLGDHNNTPVILKAENSINKFEYKGVNVVVEADQVSEEKVSGIKDLHIFKSLTLAKDADLNASYIHVELGGSLNAGACKVNAYTIENSGTFVLEGSTVEAKVENKAQMNVTKDATITGNITNDNDCINCGKDDAVVTIEEAATLTVNGDIENKDKFDNNGVLNVEKNVFTNTGRFETADAFIGRIENGEYNYDTNEGSSIYINGTVTLRSNEPWSENKGYIYIYPEAKLIGVNTSDTFIKNEKEGFIANDGMLHQVSNDGSIVTGEGSYTREMSGTGTINNSNMADVVYGPAQTCQYAVEDVTGMTIKELQDNVTKAKANQLWIQSGTLKPYTDNTLAGVDGSFTNGVIFGAVTFEGGKRLEIKTNELSFGQPSTIKDGELVIYNWKVGSKSNAVLIVAEPAKLTIEQGATLRGSSEAELIITNYGTIHNAGTVSYIANADDCKEDNSNGYHWSGNPAN